MKRILLGSLAILSLGFVAWAQGPYAPAVFKNGADIMAELEKGKANPGGTAVSIIETDDFGVSVRRRTDDVVQYAPSHPLSVEIYRILDGSGTLVTGGVLDPPAPPPTPQAPDNQRSSGVKGGTARDVKAGDVLVIPANSPHQFTKINGSITYMEFRVRSKWAGVQ